MFDKSESPLRNWHAVPSGEPDRPGGSRQPFGERVSTSSPSASADRRLEVVLRADYDPSTIARSYVEAGAAALSVLTEPTFFDGSLEHLVAVRAAVDVPLLRKDFVVSEYQLFEAKAAGADAVLLIVASLDRGLLGQLMRRAAEIGLDVLVEVHRSEELALALDLGARMVGVNNRNLRTLDVDVQASDTLISLIPPGVAAISESGLRMPADVLRLRTLGYRAFLIGERFMTADDPGAELRRLLQGCATTGTGSRNTCS